MENRYAVINATRIQDANEWVQMIEQAQIDFSITDEDWSQYNLPGGDSPCISREGCPTSEDFCTTYMDEMGVVLPRADPIGGHSRQSQKSSGFRA